MFDESKIRSEDRSGDLKNIVEEVDVNISDGDINIDVDGKENFLENVEGNDKIFDYENKFSYSYKDLFSENMLCIRESEGEDDIFNVIVGEESDQFE